MKKHLLLTTLLAIIGLSVFSQEQKIKLDESKKLGSATKSQIFTMECLGEINTVTADLKWRPILTNICFVREPRVPDYEMLEKIKAEKLI
jgi:hypothetical protein